MRGLLAPRPRNDSPVPLTGGRLGFNLPWGRPAAGGDTLGELGTMATNGTVFGIVNRTSTAVAKTEWKLYRKAKSGKDEDRTEVTSHAALDLVNRPNPFFTRMLFFETEQQHLDLTGEAWIVVAYNQRVRNLPLELWPVRPDRITPVPHPTKYLSGYIYTSPDGEEVPLDVNQVLSNRMPNPRDPYRGLGPVQSILTDIQSAEAASAWNRNFFLNSAEPGGIVQVERSLSDGDFERLRRRWNEQHRGVSNAHRVAILEEAQWVERKYTQRDMQFTELRGVSRDQILEAFGFPRSMLGITEDVNRANADAGEYVFAKWLTVPRLDRWRDMLNTALLPLYGPGTTDLYEFDYDSPVPEDEAAELAEMTAKASAAQTYINAGFEPESVVEALELPDALVFAEPEPTPPQLAPFTGEQDPGQPPAAPEPPGAPPAPEPPAPPEARHRWITASLDGPTLPEPPPADGPPERDTETVDGIDLGPVQREWEKAVDATTRSWNNTILPDWIDQLVAAVEAALRDGGDLATLALDVAAATALLTGAMTAMADTAAARAVKEAAKQKVDLHAITPPRAILTDTASLTVRFEAQRMATSAGYEAARIAAGRTPAQVGEAVRAHLEALTDAQPRQMIGAALSDAQNEARHRTFRSGPVGALYASEQLDTNTCLAPDALVTTRRGEVRADEVTLDDELLTHTGRWVPPSDIIISEADEDLVVAELGNGGRLRLTDDHPVLVLDHDELVWREAGQLTEGTLMVGQASLEQGGELVVPDLVLGQTPHGVSAVDQIGGLSAVNMRPEAVPVAPVGLDDESLADEEVDDPRADLGLRHEGEPTVLQTQPHGALNAGLEAAGHVAARRTVAAVLSQRRDHAHAGAAVLAGDVDRRSAAGFRAVATDLSASVAEGGAAASTDSVAATGSRRAGAGAVVVAAGGGDRHGERARAMGAGLLDAVSLPRDLGQEFGVGELAGDGAVDGASLVPAGDLAGADLAVARREPLSPALPGGIRPAAFASGDLDSAVDTRSIHLINVVEVTAVRREAHRGYVYDFTVPGDETFWAEGVLVHNCKNCRAIHGRWICNTDDQTPLYKLYPHTGYVDCLGRDRCRGTVVGVWRKGQEDQ